MDIISIAVAKKYTDGDSSVTINGITGTTFTLDKIDVGLSNVDNIQQIPMSQKGAISGVATLDASGKVPLSQISVTNATIVAVADQTARLALTQSTNLIIAIQSDTNWVWGLNSNQDPSIISNWVDMGSADAKVVSVNGATGVVTVDKTTIGLANVDNTSDINKAVLSATKLATARTINNVSFDGTANITVEDSTKIPTSYLDIDGTLIANSDVKIASQKAIKSYVDTSKGTSNDFSIGGYTKLGSDAPSIKIKKYTGNMPSVGNSIYIPHGLNNAKIINFSCVVTDSSGTLRLPNTSASADIEYYFRIKPDNTIWLTTGANGTLIAGMPFTVCITYEV